MTGPKSSTRRLVVNTTTPMMSISTRKAPTAKRVVCDGLMRAIVGGKTSTEFRSSSAGPPSSWDGWSAVGLGYSCHKCVASGSDRRDVGGQGVQVGAIHSLKPLRSLKQAGIMPIVSKQQVLGRLRASLENDVTEKIRFRASDRLIEAEPKALGQRVPEPLHRRLIELCDAVYEGGEPHRPTKADMLAALIFAAPEDPTKLVEILQRYGKARVGDAVLTRSDNGDVIEFAPRTSGPRRGGAG